MKSTDNEADCGASTEDAALQTLRTTLITEGRLQEACEISRRMVERWPLKPELHHQMAWLKASIKDLAKAIHHQERAIELEPSNAGYRLSLIKYLQARTAQEAAALAQLDIKDHTTFEECQKVEKNLHANKLQRILEDCLPNWPHCVDLNVRMRSKWILQSHWIDSVPNWIKFIPQRFMEGDVAEIIGIGSFHVGNPRETLQKRISRGMPWELPIAVLARELVSRANPKSLIVEVGANIGTLTVPIALNFPGEVLAFEPVKQTFDDLTKNVSLNEIQNIRMEMKACGARLGFGEMSRLLDENRGMAQLNIVPTGSVTVTTIDKEAATIGSAVALIKIDVEGHEMEVLAGAVKTIQQDKPLIIVELRSENVSKCIESMKSFGYGAQRIFRSDWIFYPSHI